MNGTISYYAIQVKLGPNYVLVNTFTDKVCETLYMILAHYIIHVSF